MRFKTPKSPKLDPERAEAVAAEGLAFLAEDPGKLSHFMTQTGLSADVLRAQAGSRDVLCAVLEYLNGDEPLLLTFAAAHRMPPEAIGAALRLLQGDGSWE